MNMTVENVDMGSVILKDAVHADFTITDPASPKAWAEGTIFVVDAAGVATEYDDGAYVSGTALAVMTCAQETEGGADVYARLMVAGQVRTERLVIDNGNPVEQVTVNRLRNFSLVAVDVRDCSVLDNQ